MSVNNDSMNFFERYLLRNEKYLTTAGELAGQHFCDNRIDDEEISIFFTTREIGIGDDYSIDEASFNSWYEKNAEAIASFLNQMDTNYEYTSDEAKKLFYDSMTEMVQERNYTSIQTETAPTFPTLTHNEGTPSPTGVSNLSGHMGGGTDLYGWSTYNDGKLTNQSVQIYNPNTNEWQAYSDYAKDKNIFNNHEVEFYVSYNEDDGSIKEFTYIESGDPAENGKVTEKTISRYTEVNGVPQISIITYDVSYTPSGEEILTPREEDNIAADYLNNAISTGKLTKQEAAEMLAIYSGQKNIANASFLRNDEKYAIYNELAYGKPIEPGENGKSKAAELMDEIGKEYGISFFVDNDIITQEYANEHGITSGNILTPEMLETLKKTLEEMKAHGQKMPERVYITEHFGYNFSCGGCFSGAGSPEGIFINSTAIRWNDTNWLEGTILHEAGHMANYDASTGGDISDVYKDDISFEECDQDKNYIGSVKLGEKLIKQIAEALGLSPDDSYFSDENISSFIARYVGCTTNSAEFVAVMTNIISDGSIVVDANGNHSVNSHREDGKTRDDWRCQPWDGDTKALNIVMELYKILCGGTLISSPSLIQEN